MAKTLSGMMSVFGPRCIIKTRDGTPSHQSKLKI